ncbi:hypothetical protein NJ8700_06405 [Aggregatibacter aphrophilus NJ8700]|nr:hypothetical protein NT05HA_1364 [Aggregatibacter aphrophilus NJ8700]AKS65046.1 hypothetical protein NJ8700_06405 [Aggregatibacter aphrophilus NJ8700]
MLFAYKLNNSIAVDIEDSEIIERTYQQTHLCNVPQKVPHFFPLKKGGNIGVYKSKHSNNYHLQKFNK